MCLSRINLKFITKYTTYNAKNGANLLRWITVCIWWDYENMKKKYNDTRPSKSLWINKDDFRSKSKHFINKYKDMSRINLNSISQYSFDIKCFDIVSTKRKNSHFFKSHEYFENQLELYFEIFFRHQVFWYSFFIKRKNSLFLIIWHTPFYHDNPFNLWLKQFLAVSSQNQRVRVCAGEYCDSLCRKLSVSQ